ncbi:structural ppiase-like protein [Tupanvirus deep ocean]|uniref:Structural ppiase-like protein n=2 Tax=Tupanvirus TaxID=2094720 RepID=A0AC62A783_9VIRU|nr:structural ppiase-like protein [Tupanvirus deep ocean]QKU33591.1 structural ppiase-like protein [Tupanvirus deep ocean]
MNYSLKDLPDSGKNPVVYMDISLKGEVLGRILIRLFRDVFPAGVENFVKIAGGRTYKIIKKGTGRFKYTKQIRRTYEGCKFFHFLHNNYVISGDIYNNNGANAGTIYNDEPIPADFGEFYYPHEAKGLVSLVPFKDETTGKLFYDSTFMITLDDIKPTNILNDLDKDHIVIGQVYSGIDVLDKMNQLIKPYAGRKYPDFVISRSDVYRKQNGNRRIRPITVEERKKFINEPSMVVPNKIDVETFV